MSNIVKANPVEALTGLVVVLIAAAFLAFALGRTGGTGAASYALTARFPNASGVAIGSDVRVSGMKVGSVTGQSLDPEGYQAVVTLSVEDSLKLPADTSAAITSEGLLGGTYIALIPGGDPEPLRPGDEITDTQGATDLMGLIGSFINRGSSDSAADTAPTETTADPAQP